MLLRFHHLPARVQALLDVYDLPSLGLLACCHHVRMHVAQLVLLHRPPASVDRASDHGGFGAAATDAAKGRVEAAAQSDRGGFFVRHCATSSALAIYARQPISRADTHSTAS